MAIFLMTAWIWLPTGFVLHDEEPEFPLSEIRVEGTKSRDIIVSTSGLKVGGTYTERRISLARRALFRLPFVFDADLSLQRGPKYGTYVLVIHIQTVTNLFYRYDFNSLEASGSPIIGQARPRNEEDKHHVLSFGGRLFWGKSGLIYATSDLEYQDGDLDLAAGKPIDLGASYYNLFDMGVFLNFNLQFRDVVDEGKLFDPYLQKDLDYTGKRDPAPHLTLALPLDQGLQWLSLNVGYLRERLHFRGEPTNPRNIEDGVNESRLRMELSWLRDSTDDLVFPSQGFRLEAGLAHSRVRSNFSVSLAASGGELVAFTLEPDVLRLVNNVTNDALMDVPVNYSGRNLVEGTELFASAAAYMPWQYRLILYARGAFSSRVSEHGALIRDPNAQRAGLTLGFEREIFSTDSRFFLEASSDWSNNDFLRETANTIEAGLAWRTRAGLMRLAIQFQDLDSKIRGQGYAP